MRTKFYWSWTGGPVLILRTENKLKIFEKKEKNFTKFIYVAQILCQATTKMYF